MEEILDFVAIALLVESRAYIGFRCAALGRETAALLCRQWTSCTLRDLSAVFWLKHLGSPANLVRRARANLDWSASYRKKFDTLIEELI